MPFIPPFGSPPGGAAGASLALDNLASVAINTSLISDADSTDDLGSSTKAWANAYIDKIYFANTQTQTDFHITGWDAAQVRHQGVILENDSGYAYLVLKGSGDDAGEIRFESDNYSDAGNITVFQNDMTIHSDDKITISWASAVITFDGAYIRPNTDSQLDLGDSTHFWDQTFTDELILTNVGAAAAAADKLVLSAVDLSAGNTILDINTEGTGVEGTGTPAADKTIAIRVNGNVRYLLASTVAS